MGSWLIIIIIIIIIIIMIPLGRLAAMSSQARKPKVKWTEQMNKDVLECKKKAQELVSSENPPCN